MRLHGIKRDRCNQKIIKVSLLKVVDMGALKKVFYEVKPGVLLAPTKK